MTEKDKKMSNKEKKNQTPRGDYLTAGKEKTNALPEENADREAQGEASSKKCFWTAIGCCAAGAVFFGLMFTVLGVYALLASLICELASVSLLNGQKKYGYFNACKVLRVVSYVIMAAGVAVMVFIIGMKAA